MTRELSLSAVIVMLLASTGLQAQELSAPEPPPEGQRAVPAPAPEDGSLRWRLTKLEERVDRLQSEIEQLRERDRDHSSSIQKLAQGVLEAGDLAKQNQRQIIDLRSEMLKLSDRVSDNSASIGDIAKLGSDGRYQLDVIGNMQRNNGFRHELKQAIQQSGASTQGRLWLYNPDPFERTVYINGSRWLARPGWSYVTVPLGEVSVTQWGGVTPPTRDDWRYDPDRGTYSLTYDFTTPWR